MTSRCRLGAGDRMTTEPAIAGGLFGALFLDCRQSWQPRLFCAVALRLHWVGTSIRCDVVCLALSARPRRRPRPPRRRLPISLSLAPTQSIENGHDEGSGHGHDHVDGFCCDSDSSGEQTLLHLAHCSGGSG